MGEAKTKFSVGVCEECGVRIRIRIDLKPLTDYKQWIAHIREVQKTGIGALVCWPCYGNS